MYFRNYSFRKNIMKEIFEIKNSIKISANNIKIYTTVLQLIKNYKLITLMQNC